jgi:porin
LDKALAFHTSVFLIDRGGLLRGDLLNYMVASGIEALPTTRLYEMWLEQKWGITLALRAGQLAADTEFMTAKYTDVFTNTSLGWPAGLSLNIPSGGPSPPLATMGARVRADLSDGLTLIGAVFEGNAAGDFSDERFDSSGVSLAIASGGSPASFAGDFGLYAVFEQKLYRVGKDDDRGIGVFGRVSYSPPDRNLIDIHVDGGVEFIGLDDKRPHDKFGVAGAYAHSSSRAQALDGDFQQISETAWPVRSSRSWLLPCTNMR